VNPSAVSRVHAELLQGGVAASLRGSGAAEFVLAENQGRAIELSRHQDQWWVEFWEATTDEDAPPIRERFFTSAAEALREISGWLTQTPQ
jgi:hypothetical protein